MGFPGGSVDKNPPPYAGDTGLMPDLGRSHKPWGNKVAAPELLRLGSTAGEPQLPSPRAAAAEARTH